MGNNPLMPYCSPCQKINDQDYENNENDIPVNTLFLNKCIKNSKIFISENKRYQVQRALIQHKYYEEKDINHGVLFPYRSGYYQGQVYNKLPDGKGKLIYKNSDQYQGKFRHGKFHGNGTLVNKIQEIKFVGIWKNDVPTQGFLTKMKNQNRLIQIQIKITNIEIFGEKKFSAKVQYPNNMVYQGQFGLFNENILLFNGYGTMNFSDGSMYVGKWVAGKIDGYGKYTWRNGDSYEGSYLNGKKHGEGKMYWKFDNKSYTGCWQHGQISIQQTQKQQPQPYNSKIIAQKIENPQNVQ